MSTITHLPASAVSGAKPCRICGGDFLVAFLRVGAEAEERTHRVELRGLSLGGKFLAQELEREVEDGERPAALEKAIGREIVHRLGGIGLLGPIGTETHEHARPAFLRHRTIILVGEIAAQAGEEEIAQLAPARIGSGEDFLFEHAREESLCTPHSRAAISNLPQRNAETRLRRSELNTRAFAVRDRACVGIPPRRPPADGSPVRRGPRRVGPADRDTTTASCHR